MQAQACRFAIELNAAVSAAQGQGSLKAQMEAEAQLSAEIHNTATRAADQARTEERAAFALQRGQRARLDRLSRRQVRHSYILLRK